MATDRQLLVADWRRRLADAEATLQRTSPQQAWIIRVRIRLYRFLLSLYGEGDWRRTPQHLGEEPPDSSRSTVVFDSPNALPLASKPAKSVTDIQSALRSVAEARIETPQPGPLVRGLRRDSWVIVATFRESIKGRECLGRLKEAGFKARLSRRGGNAHVEVAAHERKDAFTFLAASCIETNQIPEAFTAPVMPRRRYYFIASLLSLPLCLPLAWFWATFSAALALSPEQGAPAYGPSIPEHFHFFWGFMYLLSLELIWVDFLIRRRAASLKTRKG